ncbi:helix-turn-helix domain-containing protein [Chthonobacter rhizosphaerae]|uniref:helix-turn-helix domain-containing protein n=1 Tax=Chthonobacter rhizosphaerae TaxID=2735553 RepID=UPI0015EFC97F
MIGRADTQPCSSRDTADLGPCGCAPAVALQPSSLLKLADAADVLGVSIRTIRRLYEAGELPVVRVGRQIRVSPSDLNRFIGDRRRH